MTVASQGLNYFLLFQALALVEEETRRYRPTKNYLEYLPPASYSTFEVSNLCCILGKSVFYVIF